MMLARSSGISSLGHLALATLLLATPAAAQDYAALGANLFGENVPGGGADEGAAANFDGEIDLAQGQLCYFFELEGLPGANAAHIHQAKEKESGPAVVTLATPTDDADEVCVKLDTTIARALAERPADYYIDIHTADKPDGALRGQFGD